MRHKIFVLLCFILCLSGCGFKFRQPISSKQLQTIYLNAPTEDALFNLELRTALKGPTITLVNSPSPQVASINVTDYQMQVNTPNAFASSLPTTISATLSLTVGVTLGTQVLLAPTPLTSTQTFDLSPGQRVTTAVSQQLQQQLRSMMIAQIINLLSSTAAELSPEKLAAASAAPPSGTP